MNINQIISTELKVKQEQVAAAVALLDAGDTVPFISRYRKEITGGLSDTDLRHLEERLGYLREMEQRRDAILKSITEQNKLTPELEKSIRAADSKAALEDLYLPYKPKRRTKAQIAKEAGLEPLAFGILNDPSQDITTFAASFVDAEKAVNNAEEALEGARHILMELFSENATLIGELRDYVWDNAITKSEVIKGKEVEGSKFADYFTYQEAIKKIPSHRALALLRGQREEVLRVSLALDEGHEQSCRDKILSQFNIKQQNRSGDQWLIDTANLTWRIKIFLKLELELMMRVRESAEEEAINVFANNLKHLLMAAPAGTRATLGLDPGLRTGVKVAAVDETGKLLAYTAIFPHAPRNDWDKSLETIAKLCKQFNIQLISIGNGTASRETDKLVSDLKKRYPELNITSIVVSEAGASVYSASALAASEFPDLDVSYRGAVSIARRLQDPLAELVKIEPKSIGVGQYQHDVNQVRLSRSLRAVMEDCVNAVGVDLNTASAPLLTCVSGLNESIANNIIQFRHANGAFKSRQQLKKVPRLGEKAFEQAAGFLRIANGDNPLDTSSVHPETYPVVEQILSRLQKSIKDIMGNTQVIRSIRPNEFTNEQFGLPTITDILHELEKPGRDPRPEFKTASFKEGIESLEDLKTGMLLEGVITNVANFGAFVDIGVHQDGLVHKSMLANHFVKEPSDFVKVGDIVKVKVIEVDIPRKRIQLTMRLDDAPRNTSSSVSKSSAPIAKKLMQSPALDTSMGNALLAAMKKK